MTDPDRFLDGDGMERDLLASAAADAGSEAAYRRVQRAIGAALVVTGASTAAAAGTGSALAAGEAKVLTSLGLAKWLVIGATAGTLITGTAYVALPSPSRTDASHNAPPVVTSPVRRSAPGREPSAGSVPAPDATEVVLPAPPAGPALAPRPAIERGRAAPIAGPPLPARSPAPPLPAPVPGPTLAEEVRVLDAARAALARGDGHAALAELARHRHEFPGGALQVEASVLGVRALLETGERTAAEREGARVLAVHPKGPYAERVRALLGWRDNP